MLHILACLLPGGSHLVFVKTTVYVTKILFDVKFFPTFPTFFPIPCVATVMILLRIAIGYPPKLALDKVSYINLFILAQYYEKIMKEFIISGRLCFSLT